MQTKSFLRWAGSKQKLIPSLKEYWGSGYNRYFEPFVGSGKLFFSINPERAILSDTNFELVETYLQIKKNPYPVYKILKNFKTTKKEYYRIRAINPQQLGLNQRAARFIYLNKLCFNGLYRTNANGVFNVPFSGENVFNAEAEFETLKTVSKQLRDTEILLGDFEKIIRNHIQKGDFVYLDPPYAVENRKIFKQYGPHTFGINDLKRLNRLINYIDRKGAYFLLSYAYCKEALDLFKDWKIRKKYTQRNIAGFAKYRRKAAELFVTNIE
jgi:DNA adenine methylase